MLIDKGFIENPRLACGNALALGVEQGFRHPAHCRHVTAKIRLVIGGTDRARHRRHHFKRFLRIGKALQPAFAQGVKGHNLRAPVGGMTQAVQHSRVIGAWVLPENENRIGLLKIIQVHRAFTDADALFKPRAAGFVAHIGAVREVIGAEHPAKKLIQVRGFITGAPGGVQLKLVRVVHGLNPLRNQRKRIFPGDRFIAIGCDVVTQGFGQTALIFKEIVALLAQGADAVLRKESGVNLAAGRFPGNGFCAVLTKTEGAFVVIAPGAAGAVKATGFIHAQ